MGFTEDQYEEMKRRTERARGILPDALKNAGITAKSLLDAVTDESKLHNEIIQYCRDRGWIYFHGSMSHKTFRTVAEPDFTLLTDGGRVFFIECKSKTGKLSPEQLALRVWADKLGHTIHTVRSMAEFKEITKHE